MVLQPSTSLEIQINMKGELEREASTVFEACRIKVTEQGRRPQETYRASKFADLLLH